MLHHSISGLTQYSWKSHVDARGRWQRVWDSEKFEGDELLPNQISVSTNPKAGTLRGLHFMTEEAAEWKAVVCVQGAVQDVIVDMRAGSETYSKHESFELNGVNNDGILIPPGCAHGFLTLQPNTILVYIMTAPYNPNLERALRWNDPALGISWKQAPRVISDKDNDHPLL